MSEISGVSFYSMALSMQFRQTHLQFKRRKLSGLSQESLTLLHTKLKLILQNIAVRWFEYAFYMPVGSTFI